jgi:hypothetical protein
MHVIVTQVRTGLSKHHGMGGFATEYLPKGTVFDPITDADFRGFNWSNRPNTVPINISGNKFAGHMLAIRDIHPHEEITFPRYQSPGMSDLDAAKRTFRAALDEAGFSHYKSSVDDVSADELPASIAGHHNI